MRNILIITFIVSLTFSFENRNFPNGSSRPYSDNNIFFGLGTGMQSKEEALITALINLTKEDKAFSEQVDFIFDGITTEYTTSFDDGIISIGKINLSSYLDFKSEQIDSIRNSHAKHRSRLEFNDEEIFYRYNIDYDEQFLEGNAKANKIINFTDGENFYNHESVRDNENFSEKSEGKINDIFFNSMIDELEENNIIIHKMLIINSKFKDWYYRNLRMGEVIIILKKDNYTN